MPTNRQKLVSIDWVPNYLAELPLHLQLAKLILLKLKAANCCEISRLPTIEEISCKSLVSEDVVLKAYSKLKEMNIISYKRSGKYFLFKAISSSVKSLNDCLPVNTKIKQVQLKNE